ncbi:hypothetical protein [Moorena producens]|uniref:hypothetical protein n=1 Tax=Moorena producens TaxID=1155739 RepID=UPI001E5180D8|nr:hypothetical protein [Moorena producens]
MITSPGIDHNQNSPQSIYLNNIQFKYATAYHNFFPIPDSRFPIPDSFFISV